MTWQDRAACKGKPTDLFFAYPGTDEYDRAGRICAGCPVISDCSMVGQREHEWGRWGTYLKLEGKHRGREHLLVRCERCRAPMLSPPGRLVRCSGCVRPRSERMRLRVNGQIRVGMRVDDARAAFEAFLHDSQRSA